MLEIALKSQFFALKLQKSPSSWELCSVCSGRFALLNSVNSLFSTGPKLDNFCAKKKQKKLLVQGFFQQNPGCASGRIHSCRQIFQVIIWVTDEKR